jgi:hypothetical protein
MAEEFENALKSLKLDNKNTGVKALLPWGRISYIFKDLKENHLYVVVERPPTREFEWLVAAVANLISSSIDSPVSNSFLILPSVSSVHLSSAISRTLSHVVRSTVAFLLILLCLHLVF